MVDEIIDHRSNSESLLHDDALYLTNNSNKCRKKTIKGWELCVQWKDGFSHWIALKYIKKSYPMEVADYAVSNNIQNQCLPGGSHIN